MMNCRQTRNQFDERLDSQLAEPARAEFDAHVGTCAACAAAWRAYAAAWQTLSQQPALKPSTGFATRTLRRLHEPGETMAPAWPRWPVLRWAMLSVAGVLAVSTLVLWQVRRDRLARQAAEVYVQANQDQLQDFDVIAALDQLNPKGGKQL